MWLLIWFIACAKSLPAPDGPEVPAVDLPETAHPSCGDDARQIIAMPERYDTAVDMGFTRYAEVVAPSGQPIRILAQPSLSDAQVLRARNLLRFFLTDVPGTRYGADKAAVADAMAANEALLLLLDGEHEEGNEPRLEGQPLYHDELPADGSLWYTSNDYDHRDAGLEEIFHLVHDAGIGTYLPGALPAYQSELLAEAEAATGDGRWGIAVDPEVEDWLDELRREESLAQEYIASVIDSYYGLWGAWDEGDGGMWGIYIAKTRGDVQTLDAPGAALLEAFLPSMMDQAVIDPAFSGTFSLVFDETVPYTHKSRYLRHVILTGGGDADVQGGDGDETMRGNAGDNRLDGAEGADTVVYCADQADFIVARDGDALTVTGEGTDTLVSVETIHFLDGAVSAESLQEGVTVESLRAAP